MRLAILAAVPLALAACGQSDDGMQTAETEGTAAPAATPSPPATAASPPAPGAAGIPEFGIPPALQGNWGLVAADCTSQRGDAKGLLRISATTLTFYESFGRLGTIKDRGDTSLRADYAFTGEGMEWTRDITLTVSADGKSLTRLDRGGEEVGGPFIYTKCPG
ncbi:MAG: hypothetical protein ACEQR8_05110 [Cypionkella sp.]